MQNTMPPPFPEWSPRPFPLQRDFQAAVPSAVSCSRGCQRLGSSHTSLSSGSCVRSEARPAAETKDCSSAGRGRL